MPILDRINSPKDLQNLSKDELNLLATEIRKFLVDNVSKTGGHLASNLGIVELTIALEKELDLPKDKIIWDVGHQSYIHKILTGRKDRFNTLRQFGGMSGFPRTSESIYDCYDSGHSSTSISTALGFAHARDINKTDEKIVAIIGDGAMTGGLSYEALNNISHLNSQLIVILNDNKMSISKNVGGMSLYLNKFRTASFYTKAKDEVHQFLNRFRFGDKTTKALHRIKGSLKYILLNNTIFEELGFTCFGPVDGHNITELTKTIRIAKTLNTPVLIYTYTKKGKGYQYAEENPSKFHGIGKFDVLTGEKLPSSTKGLSAVFGKKMCEMAESNKKLVAISAAMPDGTGLAEFAKAYPSQFFDVGIAEGHAVTFAGGLARNGIIPVVTIYSSFLQRAYDNIIHDIALRNLHVVFAIDRAGIVGEDGETHHGIFDIAYLAPLPNMAILAPTDTDSMNEMLTYAINTHKGPIAIRYPRSLIPVKSKEPFQFGKCIIEKEGNDVTVVACGSTLHIALFAAKEAKKSVEVLNLATIKPLDTETIINSYKKTGKLIVVEDGVKHGGIGSIIRDLTGINAITLGCDNDNIVSHGNTMLLYKTQGIDAESLTNTINNI